MMSTYQLKENAEDLRRLMRDAIHQSLAGKDIRVEHYILPDVEYKHTPSEIYEVVFTYVNSFDGEKVGAMGAFAAEVIEYRDDRLFESASLNFALALTNKLHEVLYPKISKKIADLLKEVIYYSRQGSLLTVSNVKSRAERELLPRSYSEFCEKYYEEVQRIIREG